MAIEDLTGNKYIDDLTATNPVVGDTQTEGDDHIRGIKNVLQKSFPGVTGAVTATHTELNQVDGIVLNQDVDTTASPTFVAVTADLTGNVTGNIDGTVGAATPTTGAFTTITASSTAAITGILTAASKMRGASGTGSVYINQESLADDATMTFVVGGTITFHIIVVNDAVADSVTGVVTYVTSAPQAIFGTETNFVYGTTNPDTPAKWNVYSADGLTINIKNRRGGVKTIAVFSFSMG